MINEKPLYGYAHQALPESPCACPYCIRCRAGLTFDFPSQVKAWIRQLAGTTGAEVVMFLADKAWLKTRQQEKGLHVMLRPIVVEKGWPIADVKRYMLAKTFGVTKSMIDGSEILVEPHTSDLNKREYSQLIESCLEIAATEFEIWLEAPSEWKARQEQERKQAAKKLAA